ncbi:MAG: FlgD immunoglobulin-like domain containing protein [Gemmatimonadales bacterium]
MRRIGGLWLAALAIGCLTRTAGAQTPAERLIDQGIQAERDLNYDSAATLLRMGLAHSTAVQLDDANRARALVHLGATEVYRGRRDSALAAFRRLVAFNPRYRLDQLVFPPEVAAVFTDARRDSRAVLVVVPPRTELFDPRDHLSIRLIDAAPHPMTVAIVREIGGVVRTLYSGNVQDSLDVAWDARDSTGSPAPTGRYLLRVTSRGADNAAVRTVSVPLDLRATFRDRAPLPPPRPASRSGPSTRPGEAESARSWAARSRPPPSWPSPVSRMRAPTPGPDASWWPEPSA